MDLSTIKNWFFDIDDTLIDTAGSSEAAAEGMKAVLITAYSPKICAQFVREFMAIFDLMLLGYRIKSEADWEGKEQEKHAFHALIQTIEARQTPVQEKWGSIKKWSREVFIAIAAERCGISVTPPLIREAASAYWLTLTNQTIIFPGASQLLDVLKQKGLGIYLLTSSDGRLVMRQDGLFEYDPVLSEQLKRQRIELLRERGIAYDVLSIGDPEDKPHLAFFEKGLAAVQSVTGRQVDPAQSIMVGDSFAGDLQTPLEKLDFAYVVLFEKNRVKTEQQNAIIKTGDLGDIALRI